MEEYVIRITADESVQEKEAQTHKLPVAIPTNPTSSAAHQSLIQGGASKLLSGTSIPTSSLTATGAVIAVAAAALPIASTAVELMALQTGNHKLQQKMHAAQNMVSLLTPQGLYNAAITSARFDIEHQNECRKLGVLRERTGLTTNRRRR